MLFFEGAGPRGLLMRGLEDAALDSAAGAFAASLDRELYAAVVELSLPVEF
jgi:hypothetical protein